MSKPLEILSDHLSGIGMNNIFGIPRTQIIQAMEEYARECCKASLEKAAGDVTLNGPIDDENFEEVWDIITNPENITLC